MSIGLYLLAVASNCAVGTPHGKPDSKSADASVLLRAWPTHIQGRLGDPLILNVALENVSEHSIEVRKAFRPGPFIDHPDERCLKIRGQDTLTRKSITFSFGPMGKTIEDARGKEMIFEIPSGCFLGSTIDLRKYAKFAVGDYSVQIQYDTRFLPTWIQANKSAWRGQSKVITVELHVAS